MSRDEGKDAEDAFINLRRDEQVMEIRARAGDLMDETRPFADEMIARYVAYYTQFSDEKRAFAALIKWMEVGREMGRYDERGFMALTAFLARRLANAMPLMARTMN